MEMEEEAMRSGLEVCARHEGLSAARELAVPSPHRGLSEQQFDIERLATTTSPTNPSIDSKDGMPGFCPQDDVMLKMLMIAGSCHSQPT